MASSDLETEFPDYVLKLLNEIGLEEGFINFSVVSSSGSKPGDGFMGVMSRITIKGEKNGHIHELHLMLKMPPNSAIIRKQFNIGPAFEREIYMYAVVFPAYLEFQQTNGLTAKNGFFSFPKCYASISNIENDIYVLVLEDLSVSGYEMWNKHNAIDIDHLKLVMEELGKFHAISFAMREKRPEIFEPFANMRDTVLAQIETNPESLVPMLNTAFNDAIAALDSSDVEAIDKMERIKLNLNNVIIECLSNTLAAPFNVINHGDFWSNNMMYLYNGDKRPQGVYFLDWQVSRVGSPALDVVHFLFSTTDKTQRDAHYDEFINIYYNSLANTLRKIGSDPEKLFTKNDLNEQLKQFGKFALLLCPMLLQMITADPEDTPNMDEIAENIAKDATDVGMTFTQNSIDAFNRRMSDVIRDVIAFGYY